MEKLTGSFDDEPSRADVLEEIERLRLEKDITYLEAIMLFCDKKGFDPLWLAPYIEGPIKDRLKIEGEDLGLLKRTSKPAVRFE